MVTYLLHYLLFYSMEFMVKVHPGAKRSMVKEKENMLHVWVDAPAEGGRANSRLVEILSEHFGVPPEKVIIIRGHKSHRKTVVVKD